MEKADELTNTALLAAVRRPDMAPTLWQTSFGGRQCIGRLFLSISAAPFVSAQPSDPWLYYTKIAYEQYRPAQQYPGPAALHQHGREAPCAGEYERRVGCSRESFLSRHQKKGSGAQAYAATDGCFQASLRVQPRPDTKTKRCRASRPPARHVYQSGGCAVVAQRELTVGRKICVVRTRIASATCIRLAFHGQVLLFLCRLPLIIVVWSTHTHVLPLAACPRLDPLLALQQHVLLTCRHGRRLTQRLSTATAWSISRGLSSYSVLPTPALQHAYTYTHARLRAGYGDTHGHGPRTRQWNGGGLLLTPCSGKGHAA